MTAELAAGAAHGWCTTPLRTVDISQLNILPSHNHLCYLSSSSSSLFVSSAFPIAHSFNHTHMLFAFRSDGFYRVTYTTLSFFICLLVSTHTCIWRPSSEQQIDFKQCSHSTSGLWWPFLPQHHSLEHYLTTDLIGGKEFNINRWREWLL